MTQTTIKIDILCIKGQDEFTNKVKQSDLTILHDELIKKKVEINIITNISDLSFNNPIYIHLLSDCCKQYQIWSEFIRNYTQGKIKHPSIPNIKMLSVTGQDLDIYTTLDILIYIRHYNTLKIKLLDMGVITYALTRPNCTNIIKQYMNSQNVTKAFIRFSYGHNPSFLVDLEDESSFNINYQKYIGIGLSVSNIIIHPLKCEKTYMKGVISMIFIGNKYSHSTLKKPFGITSGIHTYNTIRYSPTYDLIYQGTKIATLLNLSGNYPIIQLNFCHGNNSAYKFLLTKINYIDPKLYLHIHKKQTKKIIKVLMQQFDDIN